MKILKVPEYKQNDLFRHGPHMRLNACVGENGGPYDFGAYALGYFRAGDRILNSLVEDPTSVDLMIYPLVYMYRQAIELSLKHLVTKLPRLWDETAEMVHSHRLIDNWTTVKSYLVRDENFDPDKTLLPRIDRVLQDFILIDPNGEVFRFPESREGLIHLQGLHCINVLVFGEAMQILKDSFEFFIEEQEWLWDQKSESEQYDHH